MSRPASASGVAEVSAPLRRGVSSRAEVAFSDGQLRHAQRAARASVAEEASPLCVPLCADQFQLAEFGGALVSRIDGESDSARQFRECAGSKAGDRGLHASLEPKPQAVHLERHRQRHHQKDRSRAGQDGTDQTRVHPAQGEKEVGCYVKLYMGHTTSMFSLRAYRVVVSLSALLCTTVSAQRKPLFTSPLPTGVRLDPAGEAVDLGSLPINLVPTPEKDRAVAVLSGWREQGLQVVDLK